jgi:hypothetical protein
MTTVDPDADPTTVRTPDQRVRLIATEAVSDVALVVLDAALGRLERGSAPTRCSEPISDGTILFVDADAAPGRRAAWWQDVRPGDVLRLRAISGAFTPTVTLVVPSSGITAVAGPCGAYTTPFGTGREIMYPFAPQCRRPDGPGDFILLSTDFGGTYSFVLDVPAVVATIPVTRAFGPSTSSSTAPPSPTFLRARRS